MYYDTVEMQNCSKKLNSILQSGVTQENLNEFLTIVSNLNWHGTSAEIYKNEVCTTIKSIQNQLIQLKILADEPSQKANIMLTADKDEANRIRNIFGL